MESEVMMITKVMREMEFSYFAEDCKIIYNNAKNNHNCSFFVTVQTAKIEVISRKNVF